MGYKVEDNLREQKEKANTIVLDNEGSTDHTAAYCTGRKQKPHAKWPQGPQKRWEDSINFVVTFSVFTREYINTFATPPPPPPKKGHILTSEI